MTAEIPGEYPVEFEDETPRTSRWRVHLHDGSGKVLDVVESATWPEFVAARYAAGGWVVLPSGVHLNPAAVAFIQPIAPTTAPDAA